mgnify:CR=1 FL=1
MVNFKEDERLNTLNHSCAHVMAQAVKHLYPDAKFWVGPVVKEGFYYDIDLGDNVINDDAIEAIEKEMKKICKEGKKIYRREVSKEEALEMFKDDMYKLDLISGLEDGNITVYDQGDFTDLCRGPHVDNTKLCKNFKLVKYSGVYWKGDASNHVMQRIYGVCFPTAEELEEHLKLLEEAKERDHRKIGKEMELFMSDDLIGRGLPMFLPKGYTVWQELENYIKDKERKLGYLHVMTPCVGTVNLYKTSGHWDHYMDGMFILNKDSDDKETMALRPMTCPFQYYVYMNEQHSYRDLPYRMSETSTLFRNEDSGEMHGLTRVRQFTITEAHIILRPDQAEEELTRCTELCHYVMKTLGIDGDVTYRLSKWDPNNKEKYLGDDEYWNSTQQYLRDVMNENHIPFTEADGEAAFYGPKIDIQAKNVYGKEDTMVTIQLDCASAEKFGMYYIDEKGEKVLPWIIHRTSMGCYERTLAWLIEHYAGKFPTWLCPEQVRVLPISEKYMDYANKVAAELKKKHVDVTVDSRAEKIGYKIREARLDKLPYMLVVGQQEEADGTVSVRSRFAGDEGVKPLDAFIAQICEEIETKAIREEVKTEEESK